MGAVPHRQLVLARWLARSMDSRWRLGPVRFGLETLLRFVPVVGGLSSAAVSFYQFALAIRLSLPPSKLTRIVANVALDLVLGLVPYLGDLADMFFRVHTRNQRIIDRYIDAGGAAPRQ